MGLEEILNYGTGRIYRVVGSVVQSPPTPTISIVSGVVPSDTKMNVSVPFVLGGPTGVEAISTPPSVAKIVPPVTPAPITPDIIEQMYCPTGNAE
jgi:hypothetical protein